MAHYALLDENFVVTQVIVGKDESNFDWEQFYGNQFGQVCKRTSFNTHGGVHKEGGTPFRKNFASIGYTYDPEMDAFIPPKPPFESWTLDENTCRWVPPVPYPEDCAGCLWDEDNQQWVRQNLE